MLSRQLVHACLSRTAGEVASAQWHVGVSFFTVVLKGAVPPCLCLQILLFSVPLFHPATEMRFFFCAVPWLAVLMLPKVLSRSPDFLDVPDKIQQRPTGSYSPSQTDPTASSGSKLQAWSTVISTFSSAPLPEFRLTFVRAAGNGELHPISGSTIGPSHRSNIRH